jgi:hypothetical protein
MLTMKALHHLEGSDVSVTATSQITVSAMFLLLIVGNLHWECIHWHNVHANFSGNRLTGSEV